MNVRTDFDTARNDGVDEPDAGGLQLIREERPMQPGDPLDLDENAHEAAGEDILDDEMTGPVVPVGDDEFRCSGCFLVYHRGRMADVHNGRLLCLDCA